MERIKLLLVDDHDIVLDGIASLLNDIPHVQVVCKATSGALAKTLVQKHRPDLVFTDISMGDVSGLELTRFILQYDPTIRVIVLTMHESVQHVASLLDAGAMGYLLKNVRQEELLTAISSVMAGNQYIQHSIANEFNRFIRQKQVAEKQSPLSPREIEILRLVARELTTAEISQQLFLSVHTIETHRKNIIRKTGAKSVIGLLNYAREQGLL